MADEANENGHPENGDVPEIEPIIREIHQRNAAVIIPPTPPRRQESSGVMKMAPRRRNIAAFLLLNKEKFVPINKEMPDHKDEAKFIPAQIYGDFVMSKFCPNEATTAEPPKQVFTGDTVEKVLPPAANGDMGPPETLPTKQKKVPWSSGRSADTGWPDSSGGDTSNDVKDAQWATTAQPSLTDLVPEFEPGKPWKGNQIKSIEDDPSITPGSVVRSPLSIATINVKDELFNINASKSPPASDAMQSLSSSTWSFNPPSTSSAFTSSPQTKLPTSKGSLGDLNPGTAVTSELWGAPKARGPPPGLSGKGGGGGGGSLANGWSGQLGAPWGSATGAGQRNSGNWGITPGASQWLLLRNLTAQIDGSTLRTLCMQHGPLLSFHLHLHQGFALAKYSSREEATKAQTALNNCVLGNTTILAESPTDWDANTLLQSIANQQGGSSGGWRNSSSKPGGDTWSTGWPNNPTSLWANTPLDSSDPARVTPSSLNSFLPNDLLGGESM